MPAPNARRRYSQGRHDPISVLVRFVLTVLALACVLFFVAVIAAGGVISLIS